MSPSLPHAAPSTAAVHGSFAPPSLTDLTDAVSAVTNGSASASALLDAGLAAADGPANAHAYLRRFDAPARATAAAVDASRAAASRRYGPKHMSFSPR